MLRESFNKLERNLLGKVASQNQHQELLSTQIRESNGKIEALRFQKDQETKDLLIKLQAMTERIDFLEKKITLMEEEQHKKEQQEVVEKTKKTQAAAIEAQPQAFFQQGLTQYQGGNFEEAKMTWTRFLELYSQHALAPEVHSFLGDIYFKTQKYDQAIVEFNAIIDHFPKYLKVPEAWYMTALCYLQKNNKEDAILFLKHILTEFPKSKGFLLAQHKLEQLGVKADSHAKPAKKVSAKPNKKNNVRKR